MSREGAPKKTELTPSTVTIAHASDVIAGIFIDAAGERRLGLRIYLPDDEDGTPSLELDLTELDIPGMIAGLEAAIVELFRLEGIERGLDAIDANAAARAAEKRLRREADARKREVAELVRPALRCSRCGRPTSIIDEDGTRYCKRHAEELGIRPKGKIA